MLAYSKDIRDLPSLEREISRLQQRARQLELKLDDSLNHLQENYTSMVIGSFLPFVGQKTGIMGMLLKFLLQNRRLRLKITQLTDFLFDKASDGLDFILDKLSSQKD
jgi:hypothetical protein